MVPILTANDARSIGTRDAVRVVAVVGESATETSKSKPVGTSLKQRLVGGLITFVVIITILFVSKHGAYFTLVGAAKVLRRLRWSTLCLDCRSCVCC